ncbi:CLUMA_CG002481, isoform A [Clunio marinus]|uniref:CLUMA_CG002481, isoform A n=1 Tax=Clunio marinus TaxID=568069 RepID=A0A1J1HLW2_9DIPT|nr:CLUMA_CG002481, isoform A [Clunio marinus]
MEESSKIAKNAILEALNFNISSSKSKRDIVENKFFNCIFCEHVEQHQINSSNKAILKHLYMEHRLVIADVEDVFDLQEYLNYWKKEFTGYQPEEYCTSLLWKQKPDGTKTEHDEKYFLLSDILPKDKQIREEIQRKTLEKVLERHQFERVDDNFIRGCLYCRNSLETTRYSYVEHLFTKHFLQLGKPENLVFIDELIDLIEDKITNLICIYCEKVFKDRPILKEHMRKKGHKRINPENKAYDRFFMCNYKIKEISKTNHERKFYNLKSSERRHREYREEANLFNDDDNSDWSDWMDNENEVEIICLFCDFKETDFDHLINHMTTAHSFDFNERTRSLNFYQKVKMVNFIRRKIHLKECLMCEENFDSTECQMKHLIDSNHMKCIEKNFDKPEFFFPTFEDDSFLCHLDNFNEVDEVSDDSGTVVISEDRITIVNEAAEMLSKEKFIDI